MWNNYATTLPLLSDLGPGIRANYIRKQIEHDWAAELIYAKVSSKPQTWHEYLVFNDPARAIEFVLKYA